MQTQRDSLASHKYYRPVHQTQQSRIRRRYKSLRVLLLSVVLLFLIYHFVGLPGSSGSKGYTSGKKATAANVMTPALNKAQVETMASQINAAIAQHPELDIGVAIQDLSNGKTYHFGENQPYIAASTSKVLTAILFLHQVENGQASLSDIIGGSTAQYQLQQLIEQSDNVAWENFNQLLGHQELSDYAAQIGLSSYNPDQNTLTVDTMADLFGKLYKQKLLNKPNTKLLLSYMQNASETNYISAAIPAGIKVYHKAGWLEDRIHDAAIIDNTKHPYVLVIFSKSRSGPYDTMVGKSIFTDITSATTRAFF